MKDESYRFDLANFINLFFTLGFKIQSNQSNQHWLLALLFSSIFSGEKVCLTSTTGPDQNRKCLVSYERSWPHFSSISSSSLWRLWFWCSVGFSFLLSNSLLGTVIPASLANLRVMPLLLSLWDLNIWFEYYSHFSVNGALGFTSRHIIMKHWISPTCLNDLLILLVKAWFIKDSRTLLNIKINLAPLF